MDTKSNQSKRHTFPVPRERDRSNLSSPHNQNRATFRWSLRPAIITLFLLGLPSCQDSSYRAPIPDKVPLAHVTGVILVNDNPMAGVQIQYVPQAEIAEKRERYRNRFFLQTGDGGKFSLSTYIHGDGIPFGEYALEFKWLEQRFSGEVDRLGGRYSYPAISKFKFKVEQGKDLDLGEIRLIATANQ